MKRRLLGVYKTVRIIEAVMRYALVGLWAAALLSGGMPALVAAIVAIPVCALTCLAG